MTAAMARPPRRRDYDYDDGGWEDGPGGVPPPPPPPPAVEPKAATWPPADPPPPVLPEGAPMDPNAPPQYDFGLPVPQNPIPRPPGEVPQMKFNLKVEHWNLEMACVRGVCVWRAPEETAPEETAPAVPVEDPPAADAESLVPPWHKLMRPKAKCKAGNEFGIYLRNLYCLGCTWDRLQYVWKHSWTLYLI